MLLMHQMNVDRWAEMGRRYFSVPAVPVAVVAEKSGTSLKEIPTLAVPVLAGGTLFT